VQGRGAFGQLRCIDLRILEATAMSPGLLSSARGALPTFFELGDDIRIE
jgi:hypothetical protein